MTEEKNIKPKSVEIMEQTQAVSTEVVNANIDSNSVGKTHKPSNLRGRWKRNSTGTATIKESESKRPKEINTVKIENAERLEKPTNREINNKRFEKKSCACNEDKKCCCCSILCKTKNFILALFGFKTKKNDKFHDRNNNRSHRRYGNRKRNNFRSKSHINQSH